MSEPLSQSTESAILPGALPLPLVTLPPVTSATDGEIVQESHTFDRLEEVVEGELRKDTLTVSILIPAFNECQTIREIVSQVRAVGLHDEIVIVDDFSTDGTRDLLAEMAAESGAGKAGKNSESDIRVVLHDRNQGKGAALRTALQYATGDVVLIQDADLEYNPADYPQLLAPIQRGEADVVYGSRFLAADHQDPSWFHRLGNRLLTLASNLFTGQRLTDMETCYKAFRRELVQDMMLRQDRFGFEPELTAKLSRRGVRICEVPIRYNSRGYDEGKKIGIRDGFNALYCILRYAWCD